MISFLISNGADMKKHLFFREGTTKNLNLNDSIDIANLCKIIIELKDILEDKFSEDFELPARAGIRKIGDIFEITRPSVTTSEAISYRIVVQGNLNFLNY